MKFDKIKSFIANFNKTSKFQEENYEFADFINFLKNSTEDFVPVVINGNGIWMHSLVVPNSNLVNLCFDELLGWGIDSSSYGYECDVSNNFQLSNPWDNYFPSDILNNALPIFFDRPVFEFQESRIEFNQQFAHILDIATKTDSEDFYKLEKGDFKKVVQIFEENYSIYSLDKIELDKLLSITDSTLIRFFDCRISCNDINLNETEKTIHKGELDTHYYFVQSNIFGISSKHIRGFQIIECDNQYYEYEEKEYEEFTIKDFKTGDTKICSCNPNELSNYFIKSDNPHELSTVFFDKRIFHEFDNDSEKYSITDRKIHCRGYWSLDYTMSNDKSQVIVYIIDLARLPYEVQKYWKSFNVHPDSELPDHVIKNDIEGVWHEDFDPLNELKNLLRNFPTFNIDGNESLMWKERNLHNIRGLNDLKYLRFGTKDEWEKEIDKLCQVLVEGLYERNINKLAKKFGCYDEELGSLKQLNQCMSIFGVDEKIKGVIMAPLFELNDYRINVDHAQSDYSYPAELPNELVEIYNNLIKSLFFSFEYLSREIKDGTFDC